MWADKQDLILAHGEGKIRFMASRKVYDESLKTTVQDSSEDMINSVIEDALKKSKSWILMRLSCCFDYPTLKKIIDSESDSIQAVEAYHVKLATAYLKYGGDCDECQDCKDDFKEICDCSTLISDEGVVLKKKSRFSVTPNHSCLPKPICCYCNSRRCRCA